MPRASPVVSRTQRKSRTWRVRFGEPPDLSLAPSLALGAFTGDAISNVIRPQSGPGSAPDTRRPALRLQPRRLGNRQPFRVGPPRDANDGAVPCDVGSSAHGQK